MDGIFYYKKHVK